MTMKRWCRIWFPIALILAFSGTPLRLAEAASDLARSIVESGSGAIEEIDGGVGDDQGESIRSDLTDGEITGLFADFSTDGPLFVLPCRTPRPGLTERFPARHPFTFVRRHILLERFLC